VTTKNYVFWDVMPCGSCKNLDDLEEHTTRATQPNILEDGIVKCFIVFMYNDVFHQTLYIAQNFQILYTITHEKKC
jgi:hypothetical protein